MSEPKQDRCPVCHTIGNVFGDETKCFIADSTVWKESTNAVNTFIEMENKINNLTKERDQALEVLRFYADEDIYKILDQHNQIIDIPTFLKGKVVITKDRGAKAREVLQEKENEG